MVVLMLCASTAGVLVARNVMTAHDSVEDRQRSQALAAAEAGLADTQASLALGVVVPPERRGSVGADATWIVETRPDGPDTFTVQATGAVGDWSRTVAATMTITEGAVETTGWHQVAGSG